VGGGSLSYGFSLLELLIALFMGTLVLCGAMEIYLSMKLTYRTYFDSLQIHQEARLMLLLVNRHVRLAGYQGCINSEEPVNMVDAIRGYSASNVPKNYGIQAKPNSDILILRECFYYQQHWQLLREAFYTGRTGRVDKKGHKIFSLYFKKIPGKSQELSEKINSFSVWYGISDASHAEIIMYKKAADVSDWSRVRSLDYTLNDNIHFYVSLREDE
jgi:hypothetical protein